MLEYGSRLFSIMFMVLCQAACSSQKIFATSQAYQQTQCQSNLEQFQRDHCISRKSDSYEEYMLEKYRLSQ